MFSQQPQYFFQKVSCAPGCQKSETCVQVDKRMVLFNGGICVLCSRMYVLSLSLNFVSCRNSEPSSSLEQPFLKSWLN